MKIIFPIIYIESGPNIDINGKAMKLQVFYFQNVGKFSTDVQIERRGYFVAYEDGFYYVAIYRIGKEWSYTIFNSEFFTVSGPHL